MSVSECVSYPWLSGCPKAKLLNRGISPVSQRNESFRGLYVKPVEQKHCCFIHAASPQPPPGSASGQTTTESAAVGKNYDFLTLIIMTRMKNHLSRSFESQSQCWWPRCLSPADWDKRPGCPEASDCGCELEYPLVPGGWNKRKKVFICGFICCAVASELVSLSQWATHTCLSPDSDSWLHSRCQLLKTPWSSRHLPSHHSCGRETALSLSGHKTQKHA